MTKGRRVLGRVRAYWRRRESPLFFFFVYAASLAANIPFLLEEYRIHINSIIYLATFTKRREFF